MDIQKIIRDGNIKVARNSLTCDYLNVPQPDDASLIQTVLDKLEQLDVLISIEDYEACQQLRILMDGFPLSDPRYPLFLNRLSAIEERFQRPLRTYSITTPLLKVSIHDSSRT